MTSTSRRLLSVIIALVSLVAFTTESVCAPVPEPQTSSQKSSKGKKKGSGTSSSNRTSGKKGASSSSKKASSQKAPAKKGGGTKTKGSKGKAPVAKKETSADVRRQHEETRREIQRTQEELKRNEAEMKKSLGDLGRINADLEKTRGEVSTLQTAVGSLDKQISTLTAQIADNEAKLEKMRAEYLKAVKKMRAKRGNSSALAFIFSSDSFNQAMRRMRYLRQFSAWKEKQSAEINRQVAQLSEQKKSLANARMQKDDALRKQQVAKAELEKKGREQDAVVADLKRNGDLLTVHLSKKQQEANALKSRISALIAEEERKAAAERAAAEKREAERRAAAEKAAAEKAEAERRAAEEKAAAERERQLAQAEQPKEQPAPKKETPKKETPKKETPKKVTPKKTEPAKGKEKKGDEGKSYADARRRKPRSDANTPAPKAEAPKKSAPAPKMEVADGGFAGMKGSLPRPVDGMWRVTSRFGRQELPDLPGVVYDNPGINVEVSIGATVKSIYAGKISGVYMVPGYQTVVIVNHGNYYTAYGNLKSPAVKVGDNVKAGQKLGSAAENADDPGHGELHFEVYRNRDKLNPLDWIR